MRRGFCLVVLLAVPGCANNGSNAQNASSASPTPVIHASATELKKIRAWWNVTMMGLLSRIDSTDGISLGLKENSDRVGASYYVLPEQFKSDSDWHADDPQGWDDVVQALQKVVKDTNSAIDTTSVVNSGGDSSQIDAAVQAVSQVKVDMCSALAVARAKYASEGGRPSDLRYAYSADWSDPSCTLIDGKPQPAVLARGTIFFQASEIREQWDDDHSDPAEQMFIDGHARRYPSGTAVVVMERRNASDGVRDEGVGQQCRVQIGGRDWWIACSTLRFRTTASR